MNCLKYIVTLSFLFGNDPAEIGGVQFNSLYDPNVVQCLPTTIVFPVNESFYFSNNVELSFEIYFWQKDPFGYILSAGNHAVADNFIVSYSNYRHPDTSYIELSYLDKAAVISFPVIDNLQGKNIWKSISIRLDYSRNSIGFSFDHSNFKWYDVHEPLSKEFQFSFGKTSRKIEPPRMAIRHIHVKELNRPPISWELDEESGDIAEGWSNGSKKYTAKVKNGVWLTGLHSKWKLVYAKDITGRTFKNLGYDKSRNQYIFIQDDSLFFQNIAEPQIIKNFPFTLLAEKYKIHYIPETQGIVAWNHGGDSPIATFDLEKNTWYGYDSTFITNEQHFSHSTFRNPQSNDWYILGGYGWYTVKNDLLRYNWSQNNWENVKYTLEGKDQFFPRTEATVQYDSETDSYFIFGGIGNESGMQEQGFRQLNDLWALDLKTNTMSQIWQDVLSLDTSDFFYRSVLVPEINQVFLLLIHEFKTNETKSILHTSALDQKDFINTGIVFDAKRTTKSIISLHYIPKSNELLLVATSQHENATGVKEFLEYYTINLPLISISNREEANVKYFWILGIIMGIAFLIYLKRGKQLPDVQQIIKPIQKKDVSHVGDEQTQLIILEKGVTVQVCEDFRLWVDGREIRYKDWRSKKARELFLFILLKNHHGAPIKNINLTFWPDVKSESAANSRAVTLNKIRNVIAPYGHLIEKTDDRLWMKENDLLNTDYFKLYHVLQNSNSASLNDKKWPIKLHGKNGVLPDMHDDWVDFVRADMVNRVIRYSKHLGQEYLENKQWEELVWIGKWILELDPFNDDGLFFAIIGNKNQMKDGLAHKIYSDYCQNYEREMGETYKTTYEMIGEF